MSEYRIGHVHINSMQPFKTAEFYENHLGAKCYGVIERGEKGAIIKLDLNGVKILISPFPGKPEGLEHFGIISDSTEKSMRQLKSEGVIFTQDISKVPEGFNITFFNAPENIHIELQDGE